MRKSPRFEGNPAKPRSQSIVRSLVSLVSKPMGGESAQFLCAWIFGGTTEIMKEIIGRSLGL